MRELKHSIYVEVIMGSKSHGCNCKKKLAESDFVLLDHHPSCNRFSPGQELYKLQEQCMHFFYELQKYRDLYKEEKKHREEVEKILTQSRTVA